MPIYEFYCEECECIVEKIQNKAEAPACPKCGGAMRYKFSPIAMFKMKGMGGYPSLRKAHQAGGRDLAEDYKKSKAWV